MKFMLSYKEKNKFPQDLNENLMIANKRLREDLEEKEVDYQKLVIISKGYNEEEKSNAKAVQAGIELEQGIAE